MEEEAEETKANEDGKEPKDEQSADEKPKGKRNRKPKGKLEVAMRVIG